MAQQLLNQQTQSAERAKANIGRHAHEERLASTCYALTAFKSSGFRALV